MVPCVTCTAWCITQWQNAARDSRLGLLPSAPPAARAQAVVGPRRARVDALRGVGVEAAPRRLGRRASLRRREVVLLIAARLVRSVVHHMLRCTVRCMVHGTVAALWNAITTIAIVHGIVWQREVVRLMRGRAPPARRRCGCRASRRRRGPCSAAARGTSRRSGWPTPRRSVTACAAAGAGAAAPSRRTPGSGRSR